MQFSSNLIGTVATLALLASLAAPAQGQLTGPAKPTKVEEAPPGIKTFTAMPRSASDVASAHLRAQSQGVDFLSKGEPIELNSYAARLTHRDQREKTAKLPNPSTRRHMFSVGIEVAKEDQSRLPALSSSLILGYLNEHFVSVQARIQKDSKGVLYLHHRPIVATAKYGRVRLTEDFSPAVGNSVREMHSLGMLVPPKTTPTPTNLRTLVMIHKHQGLDQRALATGVQKVEPHYEFVVVRGRPSLSGSKLDLHVFTTTDERTKLHYLKPQPSPPARFGDCTLQASVYFSRFTGGDLIPADSVMRSHKVDSQATFAIADLDGFVRNHLKLPGDTLSNLTEVLDAIIDGKVRPARAATKGAAAGTANAATK
jgi:hypothetical protein